MKLLSEDCMLQLFKGEIVVLPVRKGDLPWGPKFDMETSRIGFSPPVIVLMNWEKEFGMLFMEGQVTADLGTQIYLHIVYGKLL